jgi:hypothetical protein
MQSAEPPNQPLSRLQIQFIIVAVAGASPRLHICEILQSNGLRHDGPANTAHFLHNQRLFEYKAPLPNPQFAAASGRTSVAQIRTLLIPIMTGPLPCVRNKHRSLPFIARLTENECERSTPPGSFRSVVEVCCGSYEGWVFAHWGNGRLTINVVMLLTSG